MHGFGLVEAFIGKKIKVRFGDLLSDKTVVSRTGVLHKVLSKQGVCAVHWAARGMLQVIARGWRRDTQAGTREVCVADHGLWCYRPFLR